ncbi:hypothetical protein TNCV_3481121 [Trichonephila clavipes]|nr:hypothetical protein TNCV_3481121 [Trichonephila clavipes]
MSRDPLNLEESINAALIEEQNMKLNQIASEERSGLSSAQTENPVLSALADRLQEINLRVGRLQEASAVTARKSGGNYSNRRENVFKCFYCGIQGHRQAECRKRQRDERAARYQPPRRNAASGYSFSSSPRPGGNVHFRESTLRDNCSPQAFDPVVVYKPRNFWECLSPHRKRVTHFPRREEGNVPINTSWYGMFLGISAFWKKGRSHVRKPVNLPVADVFSWNLNWVSTIKSKDLKGCYDLTVRSGLSRYINGTGNKVKKWYHETSNKRHFLYKQTGQSPNTVPNRKSIRFRLTPSCTLTSSKTIYVLLKF